MLKNVVIVGGGVAGTEMAILLRKRGIEVDLIEIETEWRALGAGITITGPTLRALKPTGILDKFFDYGDGWNGGTMYSKTGQFIEEFQTYPMEDGLPGTAGIHRADLHKLLVEKASELGTNVRLGLTVTDIDDNGDQVRVMFSDNTIGKYDLVIAADGVFSPLRHRLLPELGTPQYTGQACWRIVADKPKDMKHTLMYIGDNSKAGLNPISKTQCYMFLLEYAPNDPWRDPETWEDTLYNLLEGYGGAMEEVRAQVKGNNSINYRPLKGGVVPRPWKKGRVVFIGDAVHGPTPHLASGAGMAAEDAVVLDEELAKTDNIAEALQAYEDRRFDRCNFIVSSSIKLGQMEVANADPHEVTATMQAAILKLMEPI